MSQDKSIVDTSIVEPKQGIQQLSTSKKKSQPEKGKQLKIYLNGKKVPLKIVQKKVDVKKATEMIETLAGLIWYEHQLQVEATATKPNIKKIFQEASIKQREASLNKLKQLTGATDFADVYWAIRTEMQKHGFWTW